MAPWCRAEKTLGHTFAHGLSFGWQVMPTNQAQADYSRLSLVENVARKQRRPLAADFANGPSGGTSRASCVWLIPHLTIGRAWFRRFVDTNHFALEHVALKCLRPERTPLQRRAMSRTAFRLIAHPSA